MTTLKEYRFVSEDGKRSTRWRPVPSSGIAIPRPSALAVVGQKANLQLRERAVDDDASFWTPDRVARLGELVHEGLSS